MIHSMTGFGRAQRDEDGWSCGVELRSVNNRFLDVRIKLPTGFAHLEETIKKLVRSQCERGKFDGSVTLTPEGAAITGFGMDDTMVRQYGATMRALQESLGAPVSVSLSDMLANRHLFSKMTQEAPPEQLEILINQTVNEALETLRKMRKQEGQSLLEDLNTRIGELERLLGEIEPLTSALPEQYAQRLRENLAKLADIPQSAEDRILIEIALLAERSDVSEEITRFHAHLDHLRNILDNEGAAGRKIEFLLQELNREANTLAVKSSSAQVSALVVDIKSELEKLREQIQNVE